MYNEKDVTVIVPIFNEKEHVHLLLNSLLSQDYPEDKFKIFFVDGCSDDGTVQKIRDFLRQSEVSNQWSVNNKETNKKARGNNICVRVLENPKKIVPCGLNIGIKEAKGKYIIRMDAHTQYANDYVSKCVELLEKTGVENVGGPMKAAGHGYVGKAIGLVHHCRFGLGGGKFHDEKWSGYVDTVYLGAWPKRVFDEVGLFDERLVRNQDIEFNARIRKTGGKIYLTPEIKSYYYCREDLKGLWKQNFENGKWVVFTKVIAPYCLSYRHFIPLLFVVSLLVSGLFLLLKLWLIDASVLSAIPVLLNTLLTLNSQLLTAIIVSYAIANILYSALLSFKKGFHYFFILPIVFATLHFSYGLGSLLGFTTALNWYSKNKHKPRWEGNIRRC